MSPVPLNSLLFRNFAYQASYFIIHYDQFSTMSPPIVLILGAGPVIGASVASFFAANGYTIVSAARSLSDQRKDETHLELNIDLSQPPAVPEVFQKIEQELGSPPSVVVYNGE